jgi:hypothetical protein
MSADADLDKQKLVAYYGVVVSAWVDTRMEKDRTLLALSACGVGVLVTLLTAVGPTSRDELIWYALAAVSFVVAVAIGLWIFERNRIYVEKIANSNDPRSVPDDETLDLLDAILVIAFACGVVVMLIIGFSAGRTKLQQRVGAACHNRTISERRRRRPNSAA